MAETYTIVATKRDRVGKGAARALRRESKTPAVIYGDKKPPLPIAVDTKEMFLKLHAGGFLTSVANIEVDGESISVLPRDYQLDPVRDFLVHIDFLRVSKGARITVEVPVHFENEEASPGIKRGGVLNIVRHSVELDCPYDAIPDALIVDLTGSDIGDSIHISAIKLPENVVTTITDRDFTVATIAAPAVLKETGDEGEEAEAAATETSEEE
ncbi:MAG: 50S ribosomal protein L25 [Hyphomicrobiales bacterium]|nr:MAG: 50S ribosomal protein L25 [Hyphomicrobiales bacterium]